MEGDRPPQDSYTVEALIPPGDFGGLRIELLPVEGLAGGGYGRGGNGNVVVTKIEAEIHPLVTGRQYQLCLSGQMRVISRRVGKRKTTHRKKLMVGRLMVIYKI